MIAKILKQHIAYILIVLFGTNDSYAIDEKEIHGPHCCAQCTNIIDIPAEPQLTTIVRNLYHRCENSSSHDFEGLEFSLTKDSKITLNLAPNFDQFQALVPRVIARLLDHIDILQFSMQDAQRDHLMRQWEMKIPSIRKLLQAAQIIECHFQQLIYKWDLAPARDRDVWMEAILLNRETFKYAQAFLILIEEIL